MRGEKDFWEKKCPLEHYESPFGGLYCMLWEGVG